jgi:hypothetical protein
MNGENKSGVCNCKGGCVCKKIAKILLIIGGLNWGLVGIGMLFNMDWNIVHLIFGFSPVIEAIIYILVGAAAVMKIFGCCCHKCKKPEMPVSTPMQ